MKPLCVGRPPEWWDTGDDGNRLALALCRVCPARQGTECTAGLPDQRPTGVIRAAVAYHERGYVCPICERCGYPNDDRPDPRRVRPGCRYCRVPKVRTDSRKAYWATYYRRRRDAGTPATTTTTTEETRAA